MVKVDEFHLLTSTAKHLKGHYFRQGEQPFPSIPVEMNGINLKHQKFMALLSLRVQYYFFEIRAHQDVTETITVLDNPSPGIEL